jgi:uncharacterized protein
MPVAVADTGPLVAFLDGSERHHRRVVERVAELDAPLLVCEPVLADNVSAWAVLQGARCPVRAA